MDEYLKTLLEQIRCKKARPYVKKELQDQSQIRMMTIKVIFLVMTLMTHQLEKFAVCLNIVKLCAFLEQ